MEPFVDKFFQDSAVRMDCMIEWKARTVAKDIVQSRVTPATAAFIAAFEVHPHVLDHTINWDLPQSQWLESNE